jgi:hypothetical protein
MTGSTTSALFGILVAVFAAMSLNVWYVLDFQLINPFYDTLLLLSSPFFVAMGLAPSHPVVDTRSVAERYVSLGK